MLLLTPRPFSLVDKIAFLNLCKICLLSRLCISWRYHTIDLQNGSYVGSGIENTGSLLYFWFSSIFFWAFFWTSGVPSWASELFHLLAHGLKKKVSVEH